MRGYAEVHDRLVNLTVMRILLIAGRDLSGFMEAGLNDLGHDVRVAGNVDEAVRVLEREAPDVLVLDLSAAVLAFRGRLSATMGWRAPRLALTSGDPGESYDALSLADDYLTKPFHFGEFLEKLSQLSKPLQGIREEPMRVVTPVLPGRQGAL